MHEIAICCEGDEFLTIALLGRSHPEATDYWDGNWVTASVEARAGGFRGSVGGHLRAEELAAFHDQLARLQESLRGTPSSRRWRGGCPFGLKPTGGDISGSNASFVTSRASATRSISSRPQTRRSRGPRAHSWRLWLRLFRSSEGRNGSEGRPTTEGRSWNCILKHCAVEHF